MSAETRRIEVRSSEALDEINTVEDIEEIDTGNTRAETKNESEIPSANNNESGESTNELSLVWRPALEATVCSERECDCELPHYIPGKEGYTCTNLFSILRNGHHFFGEKMRKLKSNVFLMYLSGQRVLLNDSKSISVLFDEKVIEKEEGFGFQVFNRKALECYRPLVFQNGKIHKKNKTIFLQFMDHVKEMYTPEKLFYVVSYEMENLAMKTTLDTEFEDAAFLFTANVITKILLGATLHYPHLKLWLRDCLVKKIYKPKLKKETEVAYKMLIEEIKATPYFSKLRDIGDKDFEENDLAKELLVMITINAMGAVTNLFLSCIVYLSKISNGDKQLLELESLRFKESKDMNDLFYANGFVLEVLRLHPPAHKIFGIASKDFLMQSETGQYFTPKNMLLCGNIYQSQRSENYFKNAEMFDMRRFIDSPHLKSYLLSFGGSFNKDLEAPHHCIAQHLSTSILKVCVATLCDYNIEFRSEPYWSGTKYKRFAASDKPISMKTFHKKENLKENKKGKRMYLKAKTDFI